MYPAFYKKKKKEGNSVKKGKKENREKIYLVRQKSIWELKQILSRFVVNKTMFVYSKSYVFFVIIQ